MSVTDQAAVEAEERRIRQRTARAWVDWCDEQYVRQLCLLAHLARGRKVPVIYCRNCGRRHI